MKNIISLLNPEPPIGGIEINDFSITFVLIHRGRVTNATVEVPQGVVEDGQIKDKTKYKEALKKLHEKITGRKNKKIYGIINITDNNVYTQIFTVPLAAAGNIEESARLNLQMISPIDFNNAYADWQKVGENEKNGGQAEILGAFAEKRIIDDVIECLKESNFVPVAVEFASLALARIVSERGSIKTSKTKPTKKNYVVIYFDSRGLSVGFIKENNLYFNHFVRWPISNVYYVNIEEFKEMLVRETKKMLNFVVTHWHESLETVLYVNRIQELEQEIEDVMKKNFGTNAEEMVIAPEWKIDPGFIGAAGSALRGAIPRVRDIFISVTNIGTEDEFRQERIMNFVRIWRNVVMVTLVFLVITFGTVHFFLNGMAQNLAARSTVNTKEEGEFEALAAEVRGINQTISFALAARAERSAWTGMIEVVRSAGGSAITIKRIFMQAKEAPIIIRAEAINESAISEFKKNLETQVQFESVEYNLGQINEIASGGVEFTIIVRLKKDARFSS